MKEELRLLEEIDKTRNDSEDSQLGETLRNLRESINSSDCAWILQYLPTIQPKNRFCTWLVLLQALNVDRSISVCKYAPLCFHFTEELNIQDLSGFTVKFTLMAKSFIEKCVYESRPAAAIRFSKNAIKVLAPNPNHLTPIHPLFLQVCILSKMYHVAENLLEVPIFEVEELYRKKKILTTLDALTYFYYGGIVYIALKKYHKALEFLTMCLSIPGHTLSQVSIEAIRKYILVTLILGGNPENYPKSFSHSVSKKLKSPMTTSYFAFASSFESNSEVKNYKAEFEIDGNWGIAKQALSSASRRQIVKLTQAYVTLSLADISSKIKLPPQKVETLVLEMIHKGDIFAKINQKDGMVSFYSSPEKYDSNSTINLLDSNIRKAMELGSKVHSLHQKVMLSPGYISKVVGSEKSDDSQKEEQSEKHMGGISMY